MKFTKGDIVVNKEKLGFFHKKHIRLALDEVSSGNSLVDEYLIDPVLQRAREIETERQRRPVDEVQTSSSDQNFVSLLGEPIIHLQPTGSDMDNDSTRNRLRGVLRISRSEAVAASSVIEANKYLIWQPSARHIRDTYPQLLATLAGVSIGGSPSSTTDVLDLFIDRLGRIDEAHWAAGSVHDALKDIIELVVCHEGENPPVSAGYKFLRWALLGLDNGPQISHLTEYLGKTETLRRMQLARSIVVSEATHRPGG